MKLAIIAPNQLLCKCARLSKYHMVLAHEYLSNIEYEEFYLMRSGAGDEIILDNGAFENGESIDSYQLMQIAKWLKPNYIILPDARFDTQKTLKLTKQGIKDFSNSSARLVGVPQGKNLQEIICCYEELLKIPGVDSIGIYEEIGRVAGLGTRYDFCKYLEANGYVDKKVYYHCLGMEENISDTIKLKEFKWIEGVDSAKPVVYGLSNLDISTKENYSKYPHRPKNYFEMSISEEQTNMSVYNCNWLLNSLKEYADDVTWKQSTLTMGEE